MIAWILTDALVTSGAFLCGAGASRTRRAPVSGNVKGIGLVLPLPERTFITQQGIRSVVFFASHAIT